VLARGWPPVAGVALIAQVVGYVLLRWLRWPRALAAVCGLHDPQTASVVARTRLALEPDRRHRLMIAIVVAGAPMRQGSCRLTMA
jgi:hypothetical protein